MVKKKVQGVELVRRREFLDPKADLSLTRQCALLGISRASFYYRKQKFLDRYKTEAAAVDRIYTAWPFYGARKIRLELQKQGILLARATVAKLMRHMGLEAQVPKPNLSQPAPESLKLPYLLRNLEISAANQVWGMDITYIPLGSGRGHVFLVAIIDWFSRYVLAWRLSNTLDTGFCLDSLSDALRQGRPIILNTDQGCQFTSDRFIETVAGQSIRQSMDGRGRSLDNVFTERLWRSLKYEDIYRRGYENVADLRIGLTEYFAFYNGQRPHASLAYQTPKEVHFESIRLTEVAA